MNTREGFLMKEQDWRKVIKEAKKIVFFGGAGVSKGSGIPDFRGAGGLYTQGGYSESPEEMLSNTYLRKYPEKFFAYYKNHMLYPDAKPNAAHLTLAKWEREGKLTSVITQNVDGLHQMAGSKNVVELHGSALRNYCVSCGEMHPLAHILESDGVPRCRVCGAVVRPDVVLYGEGLDGVAFMQAQNDIAEADVLIVGGTSLTVYPAAGLVQHFRGEHFIIINQTPTPYDSWAEYVIREPIEDVLAGL